MHESSKAPQKTQEEKFPTELCYTNVSDEMIKDKKLSHGAFRLYAILQGFFRKRIHYYGKNQWLADKLGVSIRQVQRYIAELVALGYLRREEFNEATKHCRNLFAVKPLVIKDPYPNQGVIVESAEDVMARNRLDAAESENAKERNNERKFSPATPFIKKENKKEKINKKRPPTPQGATCLEFYLSIRREKKADCRVLKGEDLENVVEGIERLLAEENHSADDVVRLIKYLANSWYWPNLYSWQFFNHLARDWDLHWTKMVEYERQQSFAPKKQLYYSTREQFKDRFRNIEVKSWGIVDQRTGRDAGWELPLATFEKILASMIGCTVV